MEYLNWLANERRDMNRIAAGDPDKFLNGYGKRTTDSLPVYEAEDVMQMHPDELVKGFRFTTQVERELYEYTPFGQSKVLIPHVNAKDSTARHRRIEELQRRLRCEWEDADRVHRAMEIIEADTKVVNRFVERCLQMGVEKLEGNIQYIESLAKELKELESPEVLEVERDDVWGTQGEWNRKASCGAEALLAHVDDMMTQEHSDWWNRWYGDVDPQLVDWFVRMKAGDEGQNDWDEQEKVEADHLSLGSIELIGYHPIERGENDWIDSQPLTFQMLIKTVREVKSYETLKPLAKAVYATTWETYTTAAQEAGMSTREIKALKALVRGEVSPYNAQGDLNGKLRFKYRINMEAQNKVLAFWFENIPPMTKDQRSVFFTFHSIKRSEMGMQPRQLADVQGQGQVLLKRIAETKTEKQLKWLGSKMMDWQLDRKAKCRLVEPEWQVIWKAYKERKEDFKQAAA